MIEICFFLVKHGLGIKEAVRQGAQFVYVQRKGGDQPKKKAQTQGEHGHGNLCDQISEGMP